MIPRSGATARAAGSHLTTPHVSAHATELRGETRCHGVRRPTTKALPSHPTSMVRDPHERCQGRIGRAHTFRFHPPPGGECSPSRGRTCAVAQSCRAPPNRRMPAAGVQVGDGEADACRQPEPRDDWHVGQLPTVPAEVVRLDLLAAQYVLEPHPLSRKQDTQHGLVMAVFDKAGKVRKPTAVRLVGEDPLVLTIAQPRVDERAIHRRVLHEEEGGVELFGPVVLRVVCPR